jgi:hypothetical protein
VTTDILDLPDWTLLAKRHDGDEYELEAEYRLLPGACIKCGAVGRLYKHGTDLPALQPSIPHEVSCSLVNSFYTLIRSAMGFIPPALLGGCCRH